MKYEANSRKKGIALIVVLGFLTVMTIISIGFAVAMRTERLSSSSYLNMAQARLYVDGALANSMLWLEDVLSSPNLPQNHRNFVYAPVFRSASAQGWSQYYWMLPSRDPDSRGDTFRESLFDGAGTNFLHHVPIRYIYELPEDEDDVERMGAEWIHIENDRGEIEGRFMYLIFEASAFVDVNYIGRRIHGDVKSGGYYDMITDDAFFSQREDDSRYESEADVWYSNNYAVSIGAEADWLHHSYAPPMRRVAVAEQAGRFRVDKVPDLDLPGEGLTSRKVVLPNTLAQLLEKEAEITEAFRVATQNSEWHNHPAAATPEDLFESLVDFYQDSYTPFRNNHDRPTVKPVPMINEFVLENDRIRVELWSPFVGPESSRFTGNFIVRANIDGASEEVTSEMPIWQRDTRPPQPWVVDIELPNELEEGLFSVDIEVQQIGGGTLDRVSFNSVELNENWQCNDPRFNHIEDQWSKGESGTLGNRNENAAFTDNVGANNRPYLVDGDFFMYSALRPMSTPGDLGYLPVAPWRTLKLYEDYRQGTQNVRNMDRVLDYFTMQTEVGYGKLNPNAGSHYARTISSIFDIRNDADGGYMAMYDGDTSANEPFFYFASRITNNHGFGRTLMVNFRHGGHARINLSDLGDHIFRWNRQENIGGFDGRNLANFASFKNSSRNNAQFSELRLHHLMRRASVLTNTRQNQFIVCLWAQRLGEGQGTNWASYPVLAEAQAVALVWRDPYPVYDENDPENSEDQYHPMFVRYIRWMEN